jgi:hypothetical protein
MPEHVTADVRPILSSLDAEADDCIQRMRQRFNIEKDIRRCFFATTQELNAYAMRPVLSDGTSTYLVGILGGVVAELIRSIRVVSKDPAIREFLGVKSFERVTLAEQRPDFRELMRIAFRWLIYHELGHIRNGHLHLDVNTAFGDTPPLNS